MNTKEFVEKATLLHNGKYSYEKCKYINADTKLVITCPVHGDFEQLPYAHLGGQGCPKCKGRGLSQEEVIERFRSVHGDEYDYSKVVFKRMKDKVCIICPKHGEFWQSPKKHYGLKQGCPKCGNIKKNQDRKITLEQFKERANIVHNNKYDYSKVSFTCAHDKIKIICPKHGEFEQLMCDHLNGHGCSQCAIENTRITQEEFISRSNIIHNNKYDYSKTNVVKTTEKVIIICPKHGEFEQEVGTHLKGCGCPICGREESIGERELYNFVCELEGKENVIHNDRTVLKGKEIDVYVPLKKIGFEFNGVIWHSEKFGKDENYHIDKLNEANKQGVNLVQIFEDELMFHKDVVFDKIRRFLGHYDGLKTISDKDCHVEEIDKEIAKGFIVANSLYEYNENSNINIALKTNIDNDIVCTMSLVKEDEKKWAVSNNATNISYNVDFFENKLFKYFVEKYKPSIVLGIEDRRWALDKNDCFFTKIGFKYKGMDKPQCHYVIGSNPNRYCYVDENIEKNTYRLWDCGGYRYIWIK